MPPHTAEALRPAPALAADRAPGAATQAAAAHPVAPAHRALRFLTAGSVDDGKSTLIGRLLHDGKAILADQWAQLAQRAAGGAVDLSLLTDGLESEREQGITIDVAWRYFATPRRKFVMADAPGHEQYTRNRVTAAAGSDAAVVLVDLTKLDLTAETLTLLPQTRRHALLANRLRVPHILFALNKIDALPDDATARQACARVEAALRRFAADAGFTPSAVVPISALRGDNVSTRSGSAGWAGPSLLELLEGLPTAAELEARHWQDPTLLAVQGLSRFGDGANPERVFWGTLAHGQLQIGQELEVLPSGAAARVTALYRAGEPVEAAAAGDSPGVVLDRAVDISRGDWLATPGSQPLARAARTTVAWLDDEPAVIGRRYWVRHGHRWLQARLAAIVHRLDIHTLQPLPAERLQANELGVVEWAFQQPLPLRPYAESREAGALIVVDPSTHRTSAALMVDAALTD